MHANYLFLIKPMDGDEPLSEAIARFQLDYSDRYCDENNWWTVCSCATKKGFIVPEDGSINFKENIQAFDEMMLGAAQIVATDAECFGTNGLSNYLDAVMEKEQSEGSKRVSSATYEELKAEILNHVPSRIAAMYVNPSADDTYKRKKLVDCYEYAINSDVFPFTRDTTIPYHFRCFDLRLDLGPVNDDDVILCVDIHT